MSIHKDLLFVAFICGSCFVLHAQAAPAFLNDAKPAAEADAVPLLQAACGDHVSTLACPCPAASGLHEDGPSWKLTQVIRGHFLSPTSDDAVLAMEGCETHADNWGGTVLLTRRPEGWIENWYKAGVVTSQCHKVALPDGREILVCMGSSGVMGAATTELYVEDMLRPGTTLMGEGETPFFQLDDDVRACGTDGVITHSVLERVDFSDSIPAAVSVTASVGKGPATGCVTPAVKRYRFQFSFDKADYQLVSTRAVD